MINENKIKELEGKISSPNFSDTLSSNKKTTKPDVGRLKELAKKIRTTVEDYPIETTVHLHTGIRPQL